MNAKIKSLVVVSLLVLTGFVMIWNFGIENGNVQGTTLYVGNDSTYKTIQDAVDNAISGDTIYVKNGTYYESVTINTANIELIGNSTTDCKIIHYCTGSSTSIFAAGINITANNVNITGFNITVSGNYTWGIYLATGISNANIIGNNITTIGSSGYGIYLFLSSNNDLIGNIINTSGSLAYGIYLYLSSNNNNLNGNIINTSGAGSGIYLRTNSDNNNITNNLINASGNSGKGIDLDLSTNNNLTNNVINTFGDSAPGIYFDQSSNNNLTRNIINTIGTTAAGISLWDSSSGNNLSNNIINTSGQLYSGGIKLGQNSNNNNISNNIINTTETLAYGISLSLGSKNCNLINNTINTSGLDVYGIYLWSSSNNNLTGNTINTSGQDGYGIYLYLNANNNDLTGNTINTSGEDGYGIYLEQFSNNNNLTGNNINTSGLDGCGIYLDQSSNNNLTGNNINTSGENGHGIYLDQSSNNNITGNTINTLDQGALGILLWQSSNYNNLTGNTVYTSGQDGYGIYLYQSSINNNLTGNTVNTTGPNGRGIQIRQSSINNNLTGNTVYTSGGGGFGIFMWQNSNNNNLTDNEVNTFGSNAYGIYLAGSNEINITNNTIVTTQSGTHGIYMEGSNNTYVMNCNISTTGLNAHGIGLYGLILTVEDSTLVSTNGNDFDIKNDGNITAINCSFNTVEATNGVLLVKNYLTIQAYYNDSFTPIPNADVVVKDNSQAIYKSAGYGGTDPQTDTIGRVDKVLIMDRWYYYNNIANENITNISVKKTVDLSWEEVRTDVDMSSSHTETFIAIDILQPPVPTGLNVNRVPGTNDLNISWDQNTDTVNYSVYTNKTGTWEFLVNITHPTNWTIDQGLTEMEWYWYRVEAWDKANLSSGMSAPQGFFLDDNTPPIIPINLSASPVPGGDAINITWNVSMDDTVNYELWWQDPDTGLWTNLGNITHPTNWFVLVDNRLVNGSTYKFKLRAWDDVNLSSDYTSTFNVIHRDYLAPSSATDLEAETLSDTQIQLVWTLPGDLDLAQSWVYVNETGAGLLDPYYLFAIVDAPTSSFIATNLFENETYHFYVLCVDEANNTSPSSNVAKNVTMSFPPAVPTIDTLPTLTNNPMLNITGTTDLNTTVEIYNNGALADSGNPDIAGAYRIEITLTEGDNSITARAVDKADNPSGFTSPAKLVTLDTIAPVTVLDDLIDVTGNANFLVTGSTEMDSLVYIYNNGMLTATDDSNSTGGFSIQITLVEDENNISANALDPAQNNGSISAAQIVYLDLQAPVADAGTDISINVSDTATFDGSGSTDNYGIDNYTWTFSLNGSLTTLFGETPKFIFNTVGSYEVTLTITDIVGNSDTDMLWVIVSTVEDADTEKPVAHAGADQTVEEGTVVTFDGTASTDNVGISNYTWSFTYNSQNIELYGDSTSFLFDIVGIYTVTLTVLDHASPANFGTDSLIVNVTPKAADNDADDDGMDDDWETDNGLDPTDPSDATGDEDNDDLTNLEEFDENTDPNDPDSDNDGLPDGWEVDNNLDPNDDGSTDIANGPQGDPDGDSYSNLEEYQEDSNPQDSGSVPVQKPEDEKDKDEGLPDYFMYIFVILIVIIIVVLIAGYMLKRGKPTEEEMLLAEEEEELAAEEMASEEELDKDKGADEGEDKKEEEIETFECPTCGAELTDDDTVCLECGEEFDDDE